MKFFLNNQGGSIKKLPAVKQNSNYRWEVLTILKFGELPRKAIGSYRFRCWAQKFMQWGAGREAYPCSGARPAGWVVPSIHRIEHRALNIGTLNKAQGPSNTPLSCLEGTVADFREVQSCWQIHKLKLL